jgi:hypothetical protein
MTIDRKELDAFYRFASREGTGGGQVTLEDALRRFRNQQDGWKPRTPLGRRLKELREKFLADGGRLLTPEEIDAEIRERRGGSSAED